MRAVDQRRARARVVFAFAVGAAALAVPGTEAHKTITSPYTYNEHVFPILLNRCGRCHSEGGPTPMSLMSHASAVPWAQSIREQLAWERMPPWYADPTGPPVKGGGDSLTPRELDVLITWATGGTPEGDLAKKPTQAQPSVQWWAGKPDFIVAMPEEHTLASNTAEESFESTLPTGLSEAKWVKAADLLPGAPSMVREAVVQVENGPVLAAWVPGHDARLATAPNGSAFRLPAGARLRLQIHYKKNWQDEQKVVTDRSAVGLYFTEAPVSGKEIRAVTFDGKVSPESTQVQTFGGKIETAVRVLAVRPLLDRAYASVGVEAVLPGGRRMPLLLLHAPRQEWPRRYWLVDPIDLPQGARLEVTATPMSPSPDEIPAPRRDTLQVALDYVGL